MNQSVEFQNEIERKLWVDVFTAAHAKQGKEVCPSEADDAVMWLRFRSQGLPAKKEEE